MARSLPTSSGGASRRRCRVPVVTCAMVASAIALVAAGCALAPARREAGPPKMASPNLAAIHDASSPEFNRACLNCHADVMRRTTLSPRFKEAHAAMIPFLPDYDAKAGVTNENCVSCHARVDVVQHSGMQIRKNSDVSACEGCHGKTGPASKRFYAK